MIRNFSPESTNPRERRAFAHSMIEAHRRRDVSRRTAEMAVKAASTTSKGASSGFAESLNNASSYESVRGMGSAYGWPSWIYPESNSPRVHLVFDKIGDSGIRNPVRYANAAWPVIRDELAARGYGMHDSGYGTFVAVVLDRELKVPDQVDIYLEYGWMARDDPIHETSFM